MCRKRSEREVCKKRKKRRVRGVCEKRGERGVRGVCEKRSERGVRWTLFLSHSTHIVAIVINTDSMMNLTVLTVHI